MRQSILTEDAHQDQDWIYGKIEGDGETIYIAYKRRPHNNRKYWDGYRKVWEDWALFHNGSWAVRYVRKPLWKNRVEISKLEVLISTGSGGLI